MDRDPRNESGGLADASEDQDKVVDVENEVVDAGTQSPDAGPANDKTVDESAR